MNNGNYIIAEIDIKEDNINNDIRIINSFEESKRKYNFELIEDEYKYENENEIKEKCKIKINGNIIPFTYSHKFDKKGKYTIEYVFNENYQKLIIYSLMSIFNKY